MADFWSNAKTVLSTEVPGELCAGLLVYYDTASDCSNGSGVVIKGSVEVCPS